MSNLSPIHEIIAELRAGRMVILVDEEDRENEGDLVLAAEHVTPEAINFMVTHARGLVCLTLTDARCKQLALPPMVFDNRSSYSTAFTVSIEAAEGVTTGISAHDRARTVQAAVAPNAKPTDLVQPGHIFPLTAQNGGVLVRAGHTEAGCDLAEMAGLEPAAVICEILNEDGSMARLPDLVGFAAKHGLKIAAIRDLIRYRSETESLVEGVAQKDITYAGSTFHVQAFSDKSSGAAHLALTCGEVVAEQETLVRVHEMASVLDFLDTESSRHTFSVDQALRAIASAGNGVLVLLQHGNAYGGDLLKAIGDESPVPAAKWDPRLYGIGAQILRELGVRKMKLMANPRRMPSMAGFGLEVCSYVTPDKEQT